MNSGELIHGFRVKYSQELPEIKAVLHRMEYEKNGADLVWLEREEENKTFAIAFRTIPENDTGVFHILEHSVLCGSRKYPVKEPFVELLKGSLQTFLNALTYPDKTMYPIASRNDKDFLNLVDIYMDAVLHPLSISDPHAFRQEGWHYELDSPEGELKYNGVVFNEMKGAYSSPDQIMDDYLNQAIFPDNCYRFSSGGNPEFIPNLTYEEYCKAHARFYHPSNSRIFLDGSIDLDKTLSLLDSYLNAYSRIEPDTDIPMQVSVTPQSISGQYEISAEEDPTNKVMLGMGYLGCSFDNQAEILAYTILEDVLAGSNESPLMKAILDADLAEDLSIGTQNGTLQCMPTITVRNTSMDKAETVFCTVEKTLADICKAGLDKAQLEAALNHLEYTTREKDFGTYPKGVIFAMSAMDTWLYGGDPAAAFSYSKIFSFLREGIHNGYFEELLRKTYLDNPNRVKVTLIPSATLGEENRKREADTLRKVKDSLNPAEIAALIENFKAFRARQEMPDSEEALNTIPKLLLSDIPATKKYPEQECMQVSGTTVMHNKIETDGITYVNLYFRIDDFSQDQMADLSFMSSLLGQLPTSQHNALALRALIGTNLGFLEMSPCAFTAKNESGCMPYMRVGFSVLDEYKNEAIAVVSEILCETSFTDEKLIYNILRQAKLSKLEAISEAGHSFGVRRAMATRTARDAIGDYIGGISYLRRIQDVEKTFDTKGTEYCCRMSAFARRIFTRDRLTVGLTGEWDESFVNSVLAALPNSPETRGEKQEYKTLPKKNEGFVVPSNVSYAALGSHVSVSDKSVGSMLVASQILTYDYLWNTIRVKGGAYGCSQRFGTDGSVALSSYRDPNAKNSFGAFLGCGDALREACRDGAVLDNFIISTISETDPYVTPRLLGATEETCTLSGRTQAMRKETRDSLIHTTCEDLRSAADIIDAAVADSTRCVIGSKSLVEECADLLDSVEYLEG